MKKITVIMMAAFLSFTFIPQVNAAFVTKSQSAASANDNILMARLYEIKTMDKSSLGSAEKKQLRRELRSMKQNLNPVIYISAGALILIIILLIILL